MPDVPLTWLGHAAFRLDSPGGKRIYVDPFLNGNPKCPEDEQKPERVDIIAITHGHGDHVGDAVEISKESGAKVITNYDLCMWLATKGLERFDPMNTGGTTDQGGFTVTLVRADHSAGMVEAGVAFPLGNPNGAIVKAPGEPTVYHMGDTDIFGDMALIAEIHRPEVLIVPIGDRFTMGADTAALAVKRFFKPRAVIPCHYGSFPIIAPTADAFVAAMEGSGIQVVVPHKTVGVRIT
jgi:L-ascorbate metabolism protein UlaG (beta-lactamase superfamily)